MAIGGIKQSHNMELQPILGRLRNSASTAHFTAKFSAIPGLAGRPPLATHAGSKKARPAHRGKPLDASVVAIPNSPNFSCGIAQDAVEERSSNPAAQA
jgi:hypothetical protein